MSLATSLENPPREPGPKESCGNVVVRCLEGKGTLSSLRRCCAGMPLWPVLRARWLAREGD